MPDIPSKFLQNNLTRKTTACTGAAENPGHLQILSCDIPSSCNILSANICITYRCIATPSDLGFYLSKSLKRSSMSHDAVGLSTRVYDSLFMRNCGLRPNLALLLDISFQSLGDLDFGVSKSFKVECDGAVGLAIYDFLLVFKCDSLDFLYHTYSHI